MKAFYLLICLVLTIAPSYQERGDTDNDYYDDPVDEAPEEVANPSPSDDGELDKDSRGVRMPPSIDVGPEPIIIFRPEMAITLDCEASGEPAPKYSWMRNNRPLDLNIAINIRMPDPNKGTIVIDPATTLDQGYYQCFAENQYGKAVSDVSQLQKTFISPYPSNPTTEYKGEEGKGMKLECEQTKCVPPPTHSWVIAKAEVDENPVGVVLNDRVQMDHDGNLYFAHLELNDHQDGKIYKCIVFNAFLDVYTTGSYSKIEVTPTGVSEVAPVLAYQTPTPTIGLVGEKILLKCLFSGKPVPRIMWTRRDGKALPIGRHDYPNRSVNKNTELELTDLEFDDEGEYVCTASSSAGEATAIISLDVQAKPVYADLNEEPGYISNMNATNNDTLKLNCNADGEPIVEAAWFINGEKITDTPSRMSFENDGKTLVISEVCKDCAGLSRKTDLMVIQCNASNDHGYVYSSGYLNVLLPTVMIQGPVNTELQFYGEATLTCDATADDSTPVSYSWLWNGSPIQYRPGVVQLNEDGSLRLIAKNEDDGGKGFEGEYTCVASNGYSSATAVAELTTPVGPVPVKGANLGDIWWVFLIVALILLLLILLLCCCLCCQRNRGDSYPVDEKERKNGNDPEKELENDGFMDYQRPEDEPVKGSRASLTSTIKLDSDEDGSLAEYGDIDAGKFNEDGSFIGQYSTDKRKRGETNV